MVRSCILFLVGSGLLGFLYLTLEEIPTWAGITLCLFGLLFCHLAFVSVRHHSRLILARRTSPVPATIIIRTVPKNRGPDGLIAEISIGRDKWRGILTGWSCERALADQTFEGKAWINPEIGAPLEIEIQGQIITPIPVVTKVKPNSATEKLIRKFHSFEDSEDAKSA